MTPQIAPSDILGWSREYARGLPGTRALLTRLRPRICPFAQILACVPVSPRTLDVGCGTGLLPFLLWRSGRVTGEAFGVDVDYAAIALGRQASAKVAKISLGHAYSSTQWPAGEFDVVTLIDVMHHVPPAMQAELFVDVARRVKPGGTLVYKDMAEAPWWQAAWNRVHDLIVARQWITYVPFEKALEWGRAAGLTMERTERVSVGPYGHELAVFRRGAA